jgi:hypothetical protein
MEGTTFNEPDKEDPGKTISTNIGESWERWEETFKSALMDIAELSKD